MRNLFVLGVLFLFLVRPVSAQLKPGFDPREYLECLNLGNSFYKRDSTAPPISYGNYKKYYSSAVTPLQNKWEFWRNGNIGIISIRGTTSSNISWMENFYAAMIPAQGELHLNDSTTFRYKLASSPAAMVHVGWTTGLAYMAPTILDQILKHYKVGVRSFIITGHSQGGAIAFLLRSWLEYLDPDVLPKDIVIKTYCSAAPKPGNLQYAYDFDFITRNGYGFRVVNSLDWVPETPFSVQTLDDFNKLNPFTGFKAGLKEKPLLIRTYGKRAYNRLDKTTRKSVRLFQNYLGKTMYSQLKKSVKQMKRPEFAAGNNYQPAGTPIVLVPDAEYLEKYPDEGSNKFLHHGLTQYRMLVEKIYR